MRGAEASSEAHRTWSVAIRGVIRGVIRGAEASSEALRTWSVAIKRRGSAA